MHDDSFPIILSICACICIMFIIFGRTTYSIAVYKIDQVQKSLESKE